jgi:hypothetical protein
MSKHSTDHLSASGLEMAAHAIVQAMSTGSIGSTASWTGSYDHQGEPLNGAESFVTVERVAQHSAAWRVTDASVDPLVGAVLVLSGLPGRYHSHAA